MTVRKFGLRVPKWLLPDAKTTERGQFIDPYLWDERWLTNPADAEPGMSVYYANGSCGRIEDVWLEDGYVKIEYEYEHGPKTVTAREIENDPKRVIV